MKLNFSLKNNQYYVNIFINLLLKYLEIQNVWNNLFIIH